MSTPATKAVYMELLAQERSMCHGYHPLVLDVAVMSKLYPQTKAEIRRIAELPNRNIALMPAVRQFLAKTFPSGVTPSGTAVDDEAGIKQVVTHHFTLIC